MYFEVEEQDTRFHPKETVIGIEVNGKFKAYPFSELEKLNCTSRSATISNSKGEELPALTTFWFAWYAFHPETAVFMAQ